MTHESEVTSYKTKDVNLAAFLWCQDGAVMTGLEGSTRRGMSLYFKFDMPMKDHELAELMLKYANNQCAVEPHMFVQKQNSIRDLLHGTRRQERKDAS